ncbi:MAG: hypothetical protein AAFX54_05190 [Pseudomonadota bacterium]
MTLLRLFYVICAAGFSASVFWALGAESRGTMEVLAAMLSDPWTVVTFLDLYLGFLIAAGVIFLFEKNKLVAAMWAVPIFFLGNIWTVAWFVIRLPALRARFEG